MLTPEELKEVADLHQQMLKTKRSAWGPIFDRLDKILMPVLKAAQTATQEQIEAWIASLPLGFYRAELRVIAIHRFSKKEEEQAA
ncbi:hypothetical protein N5B55_04910 [Ralstonia pickettii]|uniref:hypothetical protein n=1 Tax=Ralstonia pickettii TaxID=329 RepID=UPI00271517EF|nr:hypothetical protein [Ralstonia pickettii]WKZ86294.1 hypothetical protein N5B55_04910 [Ralstonia pickettii]